MLHDSARATRRTRLTQGAAVVAVGALIAVLPAGAAHAADNHQKIDFGGYTLGDPKQHGWGTHTSRTFDFEIVDSGGQKLRLSNSTNVLADYNQMSQLFAPRLATAAGEPSTGAPNDIFEMSFTVESATGGYQPELNISVASSGERSDGAQPQNRAGGLVNLTHVDGELAVWTTWPAEGTALADWRNAGVRVAANAAHSIRYVVQFVEGDDNDVASLWVDGQLVSSELSSWENYHDAAEAFEKQSVQGPLFRISRSLPTADGIGYGTAALFSNDIAADLAGQGLLIGDLAYSSYQSTPTAPPAPTTEPATATPGMDGEAHAQGSEVTFEASGFEPFENVAVTVYSTPYFAGWFRADANGVVSGVITLPASIGGGLHTIELAGASGNIAIAQFNLARLAATGVADGALLPFLTAAGLLLAVGSAMVIAKTRRVTA